MPLGIGALIVRSSPFRLNPPETTSMTNGQVGVALVGYGFAGRTFHAPLIRATPDLPMRVVVSRDAAKVHADLGEVEVLSASDQAFQRADVDVVVIATPNDSHAPLATAALHAGKHVVVDKPFAVTVAEARAVAALAEARGLIVSVFQNRRWDSDFLGLQAILAEGVLGDVVHVESHFDRYRPTVRDRWRERAGPGAGLWLDLGPHLVDQALRLFGPPHSIAATLAVQRAGAEVDDWAHAVLDYGRLRVVLHASLLVAESTPARFIAHGTKGSWIKHGLDVQEAQLLAGVRPGSVGWGVDPLPGRLFLGGDAVAKERTVPPGDYRQYYARLRDAVRGTDANPVTATDALAVMTILEAAQTSAREGRVVEISPSERPQNVRPIPL